MGRRGEEGEMCALGASGSTAGGIALLCLALGSVSSAKPSPTAPALLVFRSLLPSKQTQILITEAMLVPTQSPPDSAKHSLEKLNHPSPVHKNPPRGWAGEC